MKTLLCIVVLLAASPAHAGWSRDRALYAALEKTLTDMELSQEGSNGTVPILSSVTWNRLSALPLTDCDVYGRCKRWTPEQVKAMAKGKYWIRLWMLDPSERWGSPWDRYVWVRRNNREIVFNFNDHCVLFKLPPNVPERRNYYLMARATGTTRLVNKYDEVVCNALEAEVVAIGFGNGGPRRGAPLEYLTNTSVKPSAIKPLPKKD